MCPHLTDAQWLCFGVSVYLFFGLITAMLLDWVTQVNPFHDPETKSRIGDINHRRLTNTTRYTRILLFAGGIWPIFLPVLLLALGADALHNKMRNL